MAAEGGDTALMSMDHFEAIRLTRLRSLGRKRAFHSSYKRCSYSLHNNISVYQYHLQIWRFKITFII